MTVILTIFIALKKYIMLFSVKFQFCFVRFHFFFSVPVCGYSVLLALFILLFFFRSGLPLTLVLQHKVHTTGTVYRYNNN